MENSQLAQKFWLINMNGFSGFVLAYNFYLDEKNIWKDAHSHI